jgi:2-oxoglutarate ferredoxin oxidoreductase subunit gamma
MLKGREVTWFPSYGAEVRGGTANCTVILSDELIGSPVVTNPDILIAMNDASLEKFLPRLKKGGLFLYDSSLIKDKPLRDDVEITGIPATEISSKTCNTKSSNMVLLGAFIAKTGLLNETDILEALRSSFPEKNAKFIENNRKAVHEGIQFIENQKG